MNNLLDASQRRRQGLNPLTTNVSQISQQYQTPSSAVGLSSPFGYHPVQFTPVSAVRQYNPQQWGAGEGSNVVVETVVRYVPVGAEGTEAVVPAPPPYSPPRNQRPAGSSPVEQTTAISPLNRISPNALHRPSPEPISNPVFPPPPGNRSSSRDRPQHLAGLRGVFTRKQTNTDTGESARVSSDISRDFGPSSRRTLQIAVEPLGPEDLDNEDGRPPAARRAVSASAIDVPSNSRSRSSSTSRWEPGMPIPPPPPGPPPSNARSQSMNRATDPVASPPTRRPHAVPSLGPVPPTPAGWVEGDLLPRGSSRGRSPNPDLHIDTSSVNSSTAAESTSGSSSSGLARTGAVRGEPKSIRERRSESRSGRGTVMEEPSNNPWAEAITPSDIVLPKTGLTRQPAISRSTPRSGRSIPNSDTPGSSSMAEHIKPSVTPVLLDSRGSTPRPLNSSARQEAPTPPFSPDQVGSLYQTNSPQVPPKSLPTPPLQSRMRKGSSPRPISHILHTPIQEKGMPAPLSPTRTNSRQSTSYPSPSMNFSHEANQRHEIFSKKEADAATDEERVRIFAEYIVAESRIRREKYVSAIDAMGSEVLELTRDLFRPYTGSQRNSTHSYSSERSSRPSEISFSRGVKLTPIQTGPLPDSSPSSASGLSSPPTNRTDSAWFTGFMPSLSPIPSMSASLGRDETSSRGRPSSRWWEVGQSGSGGSPTTKVERSKRESKYMGMPRELRESLQWESNGHMSAQDGQHHTAAGPSSQMSYGPNEYPPEKTGWHEENSGNQHTSTGSVVSYSAPATPDPRHLDISRLVTMPPPFPRHHPAVNNNHPDLTDIRVTVRTLSDFAEVEATKSRYEANELQTSDLAAVEASKRRLSLRSRMQRDIETGKMSYADAAKLEAESTATEAETVKAASKVSFDNFQTSVVTPINDLLMERVHRATSLFEQIRSQLFVDAQQQDPNATQEEGDEQPELLEKLTLLKWIFEARELLHKELYELLSDRNDRYKEMIITPYRLAGNVEKVQNAELFFADDARKRQLEFEEGSLQRTVEFMDVIETNVVRGVEVQLSAFWDIAPALRQIIEKIPNPIPHHFQVQIPADEYEENPGYYSYPMQYLYSLLQHGKKSTYQFIESQINLLCLLHEVKFSTTGARCRVVETERVAAGEKMEIVKKEGDGERAAEERILTDDLKEKVRCVEELWQSALGDEFHGVTERVRGFLKREGGWDGMDEEQV